MFKKGRSTNNERGDGMAKLMNKTKTYSGVVIALLFCCMVKSYVNTSSRRTISDLILAQKAGYIKEVPHFNTILNYFNDFCKIIPLFLF